jgi:uncharacterized protein VirK/YbjX
MEEESTGGIEFLWELPAQGTRNPLEDADSSGNYQLMEEESTGGIEFLWELPAQGTRNPLEEVDSSGNY